MPVVSNILPVAIRTAGEVAYRELVALFANDVEVDSAELARVLALAGRTMQQLADDVDRHVAARTR